MQYTYRYLLGFASVKKQHTSVELKVEPKAGKAIPDWLAGKLFRNGPGLFEVVSYKFRHLFDGMAMIYMFEFEDGKIFYSNRFLESLAYSKAKDLSRLAYREFATAPYRNFINYLADIIMDNYSDNASINVAIIDGKTVGLNEALKPVQFDPQTLSTIGDFTFNDCFSGIITTAHPQYDFVNKAMINFATDFSLVSKYKIYTIKDGTRTRNTITEIPIRHPGYMHSFAVTENYVILAEFPLFFTNAVRMFLRYEQPMLNDYKWRPQKGTTFYVIRKSDGKVVKTAQGEGFMAWHHVNAFEQGNDIFLDICTYKNQSLVDSLYFDQIFQPSGGTMPPTAFKRYRIRKSSNDVEETPFNTLPFDMPRINYRHYSTKDYQYAYGWGYRADRPNDFYNQLVKTDVKNQTNKVWYQDDCYPGEPVFVPRPGATAEDDGVVLAMVLDGQEPASFLVVLDGQTFEEIARAKLPHVVPFGFHGIFSHI